MVSFRPKTEHQPMDPDQVLKMRCPLCGTPFEVRAGDHVVDEGTTWSAENNDEGGTLAFSLRVLVNHSCPPGVPIELLP